MVTRILFTVFVCLVALQRVLELFWSRRNEAHIRACGGVEHAAWQMPWMQLLHASWLVCTLVETWWLRRPFELPLACIAALVFFVGQVLRLSAIHTLGWRWTVRVMTIPGLPPVRDGIYRHISHPNYAGVVFEIAALPLVHSAYVTSLVFSLLNVALLEVRIREEEAALRRSVPPTRAWEVT